MCREFLFECERCDWAGTTIIMHHAIEASFHALVREPPKITVSSSKVVTARAFSESSGTHCLAYDVNQALFLERVRDFCSVCVAENALDVCTELVEPPIAEAARVKHAVAANHHVVVNRKRHQCSCMRQQIQTSVAYRYEQPTTTKVYSSMLVRIIVQHI